MKTYRKIQSLYARRKAISPVVATILLIALTVAAVAIVYFVIVPLFNTRKLNAEVLQIADTNKDSQYDQITIQLANTGTKALNVTQIIVWTALADERNNPELWIEHTGWTFNEKSDSVVSAGEIDTDALISGDDQLTLSIYDTTYYKLEITYTGMSQAFKTNWILISEELLDLSDLLISFDTLDLTADGFEGTIDDPGRAANNYRTNDDGDYQLVNGSLNNLPVLDEGIIPFFVGNKIVVFHSINGNLTAQPLVTTFDFASNPFRAKKIFLLGLAGSWGDNFASDSWAINLTFVYTDNSYETHLLNHSYVDDWWYGANPGDVCISAPSGLVTEIDLGTQTDTPNSHIHTHTTRFFYDYFKYVKAIVFTDPGTDQSGPHLLSITLR